MRGAEQDYTFRVYLGKRNGKSTDKQSVENGKKPLQNGKKPLPSDANKQVKHGKQRGVLKDKVRSARAQLLGKAHRFIKRLMKKAALALVISNLLNMHFYMGVKVDLENIYPSLEKLLKSKTKKMSTYLGDLNKACFEYLQFEKKSEGNFHALSGTLALKQIYTMLATVEDTLDRRKSDASLKVRDTQEVFSSAYEGGGSGKKGFLAIVRQSVLDRKPAGCEISRDLNDNLASASFITSVLEYLKNLTTHIEACLLATRTPLSANEDTWLTKLAPKGARKQARVVRMPEILALMDELTCNSQTVGTLLTSSKLLLMYSNTTTNPNNANIRTCLCFCHHMARNALASVRRFRQLLPDSLEKEESDKRARMVWPTPHAAAVAEKDAQDKAQASMSSRYKVSATERYNVSPHPVGILKAVRGMLDSLVRAWTHDEQGTEVECAHVSAQELRRAIVEDAVKAFSLALIPCNCIADQLMCLGTFMRTAVESIERTYEKWAATSSEINATTKREEAIMTALQSGFSPSETEAALKKSIAKLGVPEDEKVDTLDLSSNAKDNGPFYALVSNVESETQRMLMRTTIQRFTDALCDTLVNAHATLSKGLSPEEATRALQESGFLERFVKKPPADNQNYNIDPTSTEHVPFASATDLRQWCAALLGAEQAVFIRRFRTARVRKLTGAILSMASRTETQMRDNRMIVGQIQLPKGRFGGQSGMHPGAFVLSTPLIYYPYVKSDTKGPYSGERYDPNTMANPFCQVTIKDVGMTQNKEPFECPRCAVEWWQLDMEWRNPIIKPADTNDAKGVCKEWLPPRWIATPFWNFVRNWTSCSEAVLSNAEDPAASLAARREVALGIMRNMDKAFAAEDMLIVTTGYSPPVAKRVAPGIKSPLLANLWN
jgi:hypothetical protein